MSFGLALKTFFRVLGDRNFADQVRALAAGPGRAVSAAVAPATSAPAASKHSGPVRSEALTLMAEFQREARLVDFLMEGIETYSDAQIGAAAREVHTSAAAVVRRIFDPTPLLSEPENASIEVPVGFEPLEFRLTGHVPEKPPFRATVRHHGWRVSKCDLPEWTGSDRAARVIYPAEVEVDGPK